MASESSRGTGTSQDGSLARVTDRSLVCMVNDQFMGRTQIPIEVDGRTYYGCCEMCKGRLANDPKSRTANDPISGRVVDKATAVIGKTAAGKTLYFESEKTFTAYSRHPSG
jgi:YHS domain-containing protein